MMSNRRKVLIVLTILFLAFGLLSKNVFGSVINTQSIINQIPPKPPVPPIKPEPPNPPAPPTKPEPSTPPPHCNDPGCFTPTPKPTPTLRPSESSIPTPTPTQPPAGGENGGTGGAPFQFGGPPPSPPVFGQVLGVSTLAGTGASEDNLFSLIFILGCLATSLGIRKIATVRV